MKSTSFRTFFLVIGSLLWGMIIANNGLWAQEPSGYYNAAVGKSGYQLQVALSQIIDNHNVIPYNDLWDYFIVTDPHPDDSTKLCDIYSLCMFPPYRYGATPAGVQGECVDTLSVYQREHTFCQSWFGYRTDAPYSDLFHIYPVDGWINARRNNNPYGEVASPVRVFQNGAKLGENSYVSSVATVPQGTAYEPIDAYKGDIARSFFYMATRYLFDSVGFSSTQQMTLRSQLRPWALEMLQRWHALDPVSEKEIARNQAIYRIQHNRNPFIDHPELVDLIWGNDSAYRTFSLEVVPIDRPTVTDLAVLDVQSIQITFDTAMVYSTMAESRNYYISRRVAIDSVEVVSAQQVILHLRAPLVNGLNYYCEISNNLQALHGYFLERTVIPFAYGYATNQTVIAGWTFDTLSEPQLYEQRRLPATTGRDCEQALIYFDGTHASSQFSRSELTSYSGTIIGDPRPNPAATRAFVIQNMSANGKAFTVACPTHYYRNLALTYAMRITATGFFQHLLEWSTDGITFTPLRDTVDMHGQITVQNFEFQNIDLSSVEALNEQSMIYLRLSVDGATHLSGNVYFDNICLRGEKCVVSEVIYDTVPQGAPYTRHGFNIPIAHTQTTGSRTFTRQIAVQDDCDTLYTLYLYVQPASAVTHFVQAPQLILIPNPANDRVTLQTSLPMKQLLLQDLWGRTIISQTVHDAKHCEINTSNLAQGTYFVTVITINNAKKTEKLVIRK